jgi:hypothetical protein
VVNINEVHVVKPTPFPPRQQVGKEAIKDYGIKTDSLHVTQGKNISLVLKKDSAEEHGGMM